MLNEEAKLCERWEKKKKISETWLGIAELSLLAS